MEGATAPSGTGVQGIIPCLSRPGGYRIRPYDAV